MEIRRLLILPSWYPSPGDKINGSFFQEQAKLVSGQFDVKVLFIRFVSRPSFRAFLKTPLANCRDWWRFVFQYGTRTQLPDDEVFLTPPLIEYSIRILGFTQRQRYRKRLSAYLTALDELMSTGWKPDLIHAHSVDIAGLVARRFKEVHGIPYVITEHVPFAITNYPDCMRDEIKRTFSEANVVLSLGYDKVRQLGMSGIDVDPNLIYNFIDEMEFNRVCEPYIQGSPLKLISIGAASYFKDHRTLVRALSLLKARSIPFKLTLIGLKVGGYLYKDTIDFINESGLANDVVVIDCIDRKSVPAYLTESKVYLMTSIAEGLPVSVLEAMACGLFIVATRHGGTEDILSVESGVLVEVKNFKKIADKLEEIYRGEISFNPNTIREHVVSMCGKRAFASRLIGFYEQALLRKT